MQVIQKQFQLEHLATTTWNYSQQQEYEKIMKLRQECMQYADKHCRKLKMGNIEYSPLLNKSRLTIKLWRGAIKKKSGGKFSTKKLKRLEVKTQINNSMGFTLDEMKIKENHAWKEYWKNKNKAKELRESYLEQKASALEECSNLTKANIIKQILTREKQRKAA